MHLCISAFDKVKQAEYLFTTYLMNILFGMENGSMFDI